MRVQQERHPVQADGGLPGAGAALHADGAAEAAPDDLVLLGLDGGDDVAHRADAGPLDLRLEEAAGAGGLGGVGEVLVLVRGELAGRVPEAAAEPDVLGVLGGRLVVRLGDRGPPVDDHRVPGGVVDVAAPDVEPLALRALGQVAADGVEIVEAAEEQGVWERSASALMRSSIWDWSTAALTQFAVTSRMSSAWTSSRIARRAARDAARWARSCARGSAGSVGPAGSGVESLVATCAGTVLPPALQRRGTALRRRTADRSSVPSSVPAGAGAGRSARKVRTRVSAGFRPVGGAPGAVDTAREAGRPAIVATGRSGGETDYRLSPGRRGEGYP